jgi:TPR repeat protein
LLCTDLFDNDIVCRPYIDEKTEDDLAKFNGEDEPSFDEIIKKAEAGDAQAQADYAIYVFSMGMQDNFKKAFSMVKKSAKQDNVQGICTLAQLYHAGIGCKQNIHKAAKWYLKGAELDDAHCQYNCFCMVMNDEIHEDKKKAVKWLERAAEQGHVPSQMGLARLYEEGSIYSRDINKAIEWGEKAAVQENPEAQFQLAKLYLYDAEDLDIQYEFEDLYMDDKHCNSIDEKSAISWLKQAADNGHDEACYILDSLEKYL